ncbi:MAG: type II secretion system protein GspG [Acidobacteria bacterium]|nr:type II secretion system protein GspG [Acidobacteriota bacterium]
MKFTPRLWLLTAMLLASLLVAAFAAGLPAGEARKQIAAALGYDKPDGIHIKNISSGLGGSQAIVEVTVDAAFRLQQDQAGNWKAVEVRTGDRRWESLELIDAAIRKEKILRTTSELRTIATALEAYRRANGGYVAAQSGVKLIDQLAPHYLLHIVRLDAWSNELDYQGTATHYRLVSLGPDGKPNSGDEIILENGQVVKGASE